MTPIEHEPLQTPQEAEAVIAPEAPQWEFGTFAKGLPVSSVLDFALGEFSNQHFQLVHSPTTDSPFALAQARGGLVLVACSALGPEETAVLVAGFSTSRAEAEQLRNVVRTYISEAVGVDHAGDGQVASDENG